MKIEKLNENKIRIIFNTSELQDNDIDVHSFMSNSIETQSLFLNMLDKAEREVGFVTDNYKLSIEAIALSNGIFIITVTRIEKENLKSTRVQVRRKVNTSTTNNIYKFLNFDDFCNFLNFMSHSIPECSNYFSDSSSLYKYDDLFFLILENANLNYINKLTGIISEFATPVPYSELMVNKIKEYGKFLTNCALHK